MNIVHSVMPLKFTTVFSEKRHPSVSLVKVMSFITSQQKESTSYWMSFCLQSCTLVLEFSPRTKFWAKTLVSANMSFHLALLIQQTDQLSDWYCVTLIARIMLCYLKLLCAGSFSHCFECPLHQVSLAQPWPSASSLCCVFQGKENNSLLPDWLLLIACTGWSKLKPHICLVRKLGLHVKRHNTSADFFVPLLNIMEPVVNALYAANCMAHFTGEDQNPQGAPKSVLLEKENGVLWGSLVLVHHRRTSVAEKNSPQKSIEKKRNKNSASWGTLR